ncbi:MAG: GNAT family N-acetyltransferase [Ruminiclostridium sp.]|nr:GNAT family N-acetyltransferase [Ruminiclostridium sp.]
MKENCISILYCTQQQLNNIIEFAYKMNIDREHASTFCAISKSAIREDFSEGISKNCVLACWNNDEIIGILSCFIDEVKNNADCTILIDSRKCDYNTIARLLLEKFRIANDANMKYTFFFPTENVECANFLESINANRQVNEYYLILEKKNADNNTSNLNVIELPTNSYNSFIELHDTIFPGVYISGADVIKDIGKIHFIYSIIENEILIAYSVLRLNRDRSATAEIIAVKENFRGKGYGRAVLSYLIKTAFTSFTLDKIDLIVDGNNDKAIRLYLDLGFTIVTENRCYIA